MMTDIVDLSYYLGPTYVSGVLNLQKWLLYWSSNCSIRVVLLEFFWSPEVPLYNSNETIIQVILEVHLVTCTCSFTVVTQFST